MRKVDGMEEAKGTFWKATLSLALFSCVINLLMLSGPLFMLQIYDRVLSSGSVPTLVALTILICALFAFMALIDAVRARVFSRIGERMEEVLQAPTFLAVVRRTWRSPDKAGAQPLRDLDTVRSYLSSAGPAAFFDVPWVPVYIAAIYIFHPVMGTFALAAAIVLVVLAVLTELLTSKRQMSAATASEDAHRFAEEVRRQSEIVTVLGMSGALNDSWLVQKAKAMGLHSATSNRATMLSSLSKSLRLLFQSGILAVGAWLAIKQQITPGAMVAGSIIMSRALAPIDQLIGQWRMMIGARRSWARLKALLSADAQAGHSPMALPKPVGRLSVSGLACLAPGKQKPLVSRVQFSLEPGAGLGIIGPSGSGKTTLTKALLGIWPHTQGDVRLDGAKFDQWDRDTLGRHIGYLPQDAALLPGTLAQNISRFDPDATPDKIIAAAKLAGVHELSLGFENGYDTQLGIDGVQLSAGQRQRVALARAVYGDPALIILDEPNSNLDSIGDAALHNAILTLRKNGTTVIVVAHRPSAVNAVDQLLFMADGAQVEFGPKEEVLKKVTRVATPQPQPQPQPQPAAQNISKFSADPVRVS